MILDFKSALWAKKLVFVICLTNKHKFPMRAFPYALVLELLSLFGKAIIMSIIIGAALTSIRYV